MDGEENRAVFRAGDEEGESWRAIFGEGRLMDSESLLSRTTLASVGRKTGRRGERTSIFSCFWLVFDLLVFKCFDDFLHPGVLFYIRGAWGAQEQQQRAREV